MKPQVGICVDCFCRENPGDSGYRGIDLETGEIVFINKFLGKCDNNIAEFIALVHGLMFCKKERKHERVYSDSEIAIEWVKNKSINTRFFTGDKPELAEKIWRAERWLVNEKQTYNKHFFKWNTKEWGENPADFGNKI